MSIENENLKNELFVSKNNLEKEKQSLSSLQSIIDDQIKKLKELSEENKRLKEKLSSSNGSNDDLEKLQKQYNDKINECVLQNQQIKDLEKEISQLEKELEEASKSRQAGFGVKFPSRPTKDDMFIRIDYSPKKIFQFDGTKWIGIGDSDNRFDIKAIEELASKIASGSIEIDHLTQKQKKFLDKLLKKYK